VSPNHSRASRARLFVEYGQARNTLHPSSLQGNVPDPPTAGFTAPYTTSIGTAGTMTIVSVG
jgi:hypothetical protein